MPQIATSISLRATALGIAPSKSFQRTVNEVGAALYAGRLPAGETEFDDSDIITPRSTYIDNISPALTGGSLRVGTETGVYPFRLAPGEAMAFPLEVTTKLNTWLVACVADVALSLDGKFIDFITTGDVVLRLWLSEGTASAPANPPGGADWLISASYTSGDTAIAIAAAIKAALDAHGYFTTANDLAGNLTVVDKHTGVRTPAPITAGSFVVDEAYIIVTTGTTDYTLIGAADSLPGTAFIATGVGSGTGTAYFTNDAGIGITNTQEGIASSSIFLLPDGDVDVNIIATPN